MIITSLLGKLAKASEKIQGEIVAIYQLNEYLYLTLCDENGNLFDRRSSECVVQKRGFSVYLYHNVANKIMAIKTVRELTGEGLAVSKQIVEKSGGRVIVKDKLTFEEANKIKDHIEHNGMEATIHEN
jgi:ribosomal protein L7/L12